MTEKISTETLSKKIITKALEINEFENRLIRKITWTFFRMFIPSAFQYEGHKKTAPSKKHFVLVYRQFTPG